MWEIFVDFALGIIIMHNLITKTSGSPMFPMLQTSITVSCVVSFASKRFRNSVLVILDHAGTQEFAFVTKKGNVLFSQNAWLFPCLAEKNYLYSYQKIWISFTGASQWSQFINDSEILLCSGSQIFFLPLSKGSGLVDIKRGIYSVPTSTLSVFDRLVHFKPTIYRWGKHYHLQRTWSSESSNFFCWDMKLLNFHLHYPDCLLNLESLRKLKDTSFSQYVTLQDSTRTFVNYRMSCSW